METQPAGPQTADVGTLMAELTKHKGCRFVSFVYETVDTGEKQAVVIDVGFSTESMYARDVIVLRRLLATSEGIDKEVTQELLDSRLESLRKGIGKNSKYTQQDIWITIPGLRGIKIHKDNGTVNISALCIKKTVLVPGTYEPDTRRPRTKAKDAVRQQLPSHRFRTYRLDLVEMMKANGITFHTVKP